MLKNKNEITRLFDANKNFIGVFIPAEVWIELEKSLKKPEYIGRNSSDTALAEFEKFIKSWDFPYKYDPSVECANCRAFSTDWRRTQDFKLHNANIGGLLVFHCNHCGATIRQKHFKDHRCTECSS